jgi:hypothetical protein
MQSPHGLIESETEPAKPGRGGRKRSFRGVGSLLAALSVWGFFLVRAFAAFGPSTGVNDVTFNSDSAIPVLMSNDDRPLTIFNLYYYGADRWGGWPFLATGLVHKVIRYRWTDESVFRVQTVWLFAGALAFGALSRRDGFVAGLVYLLVLCLHREARYLLFELSQVYAWQATAVLLSWYTLRRHFDAHAHSVIGEARWLGPMLVLSFVAIWSSVASIVFLAFLLNLEALRAWWRRRPRGRALRPYALAWLVVLTAALIELVQKMAYRRYSLEHYGETFGTTFGWDTGHLAANSLRQLQHIGKLSWWPLYPLPALALLVLTCGALWALRRRRYARLQSVCAVIADDTAVLTIGAYGLAALNFALAVVVDHVRLHRYDDRYLTLTNLFGPVSGILTVLLLVRIAVGSPPSRRYVQHVFVVAALALLAIKFPPRTASLEYQMLKQTALDLAERAPGAILMGGYWDTYVFAALQPTHTMTPVPVQGHVVRMPWTREMVRHADRVVLALRRRSSASPPSPPRRIRQYGARLKLVDPNWYDNRRYAFALYASDPR